jgi:soluble lytic murein transglycosylase
MCLDSKFVPAFLLALLIAPGAAPAAAAAAAPAAVPGAAPNVAHAAAASTVDQDAVRQAFMAAMQRIRLQQPDTADSPGIQAYVLHDYLVAARLRRDLLQRPGNDLDAAIDDFLQAHAGQPVSRGLKRDWLSNLADRRRWELFLPRSADATDASLICDRLEGRLATGDTAGLGAAVLLRWSLPQKPPAECNDIFAWLHLQGLITPALAEARARAALSADNPRLAREFAVDVPVARTAALLQWSDLLETPKAALTVLAMHPALEVEAEAFAAGFDKLAHGDSGAALDLLPLLLARPDVTPTLQMRLQRSAALGAAYDHDPRAMSAFERLPTVDALDTQVLEWRVRAALWGGDYDRAGAWIEGMPQSLATQPRWRYWHARMAAAAAGTAAAAPLYAEVAGLRDYYGYLAADRLHRSYDLNARSSPDDMAQQNALASQPGLIRARELIACDMADEAAAEWTAVLGNASPSTKVQAAHLAARWGWYHESIAALAQAGEFDDVRLRYPRPYADAVAEASALAGVPADWILSVMRQESLFRKDAVSRADAYGLMQMLPVTAAAVARRWHLPVPRKESLFDPNIAVPLGAAYLRELLDRHAGALALALAAYNAGPSPLARWMPATEMEADVWIENIPYNETRAYIEHILEHIVAFAWVRDAEPPRLEVLLPNVTPAM